MQESGETVLAIVVNFNGGQAVLRCVESLLAQTHSPLEILVVDNDSRDGSAEAVERRFPSVRVLRTGANLGWGLGCNRGMRAGKGKYIALVNNDAWLEPDCIEEMVKAINLRPEYGSCASRILTAERDRLEVCGLHIVADGSSCGRGRLGPLHLFREAEEVFCANDCCCLYKREMIDDIGDYDPDFFIYCDETDMGFKHQLAGWRCIYNPKAVAYHAHSLAAGSFSPFKAFHVERNRILLLLKYFPPAGLAKGFLLAAWRYAYQVWAARRRSQGALARYLESHSLWEGLRVLLRAHWSALLLAPRMLRRRRALASIRRLDARGFRELFRRYGIPVSRMAVYE